MTSRLLTKGGNFLTSCLLAWWMSPSKRGLLLTLLHSTEFWPFGHSECNRVKGKNLLLQERITLEKTSIKKGSKKEKGRVASPESIPIHLNP